MTKGVQRREDLSSLNTLPKFNKKNPFIFEEQFKNIAKCLDPRQQKAFSLAGSGKNFHIINNEVKEKPNLGETFLLLIEKVLSKISSTMHVINIQNFDEEFLKGACQNLKIKIYSFNIENEEALKDYLAIYKEFQQLKEWTPANELNGFFTEIENAHSHILNTFLTSLESNLNAAAEKISTAKDLKESLDAIKTYRINYEEYAKYKTELEEFDGVHTQLSTIDLKHSEILRKLKQDANNKTSAEAALVAIAVREKAGALLENDLLQVDPQPTIRMAISKAVHLSAFQAFASGETKGSIPIVDQDKLNALKAFAEELGGPALVAFSKEYDSITEEIVKVKEKLAKENEEVASLKDKEELTYKMVELCTYNLAYKWQENQLPLFDLTDEHRDFLNEKQISSITKVNNRIAEANADPTKKVKIPLRLKSLKSKLKTESNCHEVEKAEYKKNYNIKEAEKARVDLSNDSAELLKEITSKQKELENFEGNVLDKVRLQNKITLLLSKFDSLSFERSREEKKLWIMSDLKNGNTNQLNPKIQQRIDDAKQNIGSKTELFTWLSKLDNLSQFEESRNNYVEILPTFHSAKATQKNIKTKAFKVRKAAENAEDAMNIMNNL